MTPAPVILERPFFFGGPDRQMWGMLHIPQISAPSSLWVLCMPIGDERGHALRVMVEWARFLCARGKTVFRFDYAGSGNSQGSTSALSLDGFVEDIGTAIEEAERLSGETCEGLCGLRLGASLAAYAATVSKRDNLRLLLWEPVLNGANYVEELFRMALATQFSHGTTSRLSRSQISHALEEGGDMVVRGQVLNNHLLKPLEKFRLFDVLREGKKQTLIVSIPAHPRQAEADLEQLRQQVSGLGFVEVRQAVIPTPWIETRESNIKPPLLFNPSLQWIQAREYSSSLPAVSLDMTATNMKTERRLNREQIVGFQADGHQLWGTVYLPGCRDPEAPVVILSWTVTQLYVAVARALSDAGFCVLRFDPHGKGDSGGDLFFPTLHHLWYATERGFFLTDFRAAVDYAECEMGARSVVFAGICGDAITAILEGVEDPRVAGIVLLELPMLFSQGTGTVQRMMDFRRALLDRNRLLTAFVNVVDFGWYAAQRCRNFYTDHILRLAHLFKSNGPRIDWTSTALGITANTKMLDALVNVFERQIPTLCIFAPKRNRLLFESILPCLRERFPGLDKTMEYRVIPEADHVFSMPNHMQQVCTFFLNWMRDSRRPWASAIVSTESSAIVEAQATGTAYPGTVSQGDSSDQAISIETSEG